MGMHLYPNEFVIRTMLGTYPNLTLVRDYEGKKLLDLGFGDGRNLPLFRNMGVEIFGVEPNLDVCRMVEERVAPAGIDCDLRVGENSHIPFDDSFFDYVVASHSVYYVSKGETFRDNVREVTRVLKPGGWFVASLPDPDNAVLKDAEPLADSHLRITSDPFGLRNGTIFWAPRSRSEIQEMFAEEYDELSTATFRDDWFGLLVSGYVAVGRRRVR